MRLILLVLLSLWSGLAIAADTTIEMLNKLDKEYMVVFRKTCLYRFRRYCFLESNR
ncbi:MAG: hypothetical protein HVK27_03105 [Pelagibacteraceae bacterium]|nr:hypothetical protein [Pelagibacteraceae bacterium]